MANKTLFSNKNAGRGPVADTRNKAGGKAYAMSDKHALAQMAATGCLNGTYYTSAKEQLDTILELASKVEPEFVAKVALYGRNSAYMKDTPALLVAWLSSNGHNELASRVFDRVIDNGKMLRNYVQIMRSGKLPRRSLGSGRIQPKGLILRWLDSQKDDQVFYASVGNDPSLGDILRMVRPRPKTKSREALYGYILGRDYTKRNLPKIVRDYESFKAGKLKTPPKVNFQMLTSLDIGEDGWRKIAEDAKWQMTRMNLNTFKRHGVLNDKDMVKLIAARLKDEELIRKARCFPYQLMAAYLNVEADMPFDVKDALQDAMETAVDNVPQFRAPDGGPAKVWIFPDVSGSMGQPITGYRRGASSKVECRHVAALISAVLMRRNPSAGVLPFACRLFKDIRLNGRDSIMTNAERVGRLPGGGTNCSLPLAELNRNNEKGDLLVYVSDNESWMDRSNYYWGNSSTSTQTEWEKFKKRNPKAKMVCIDLVANTTTQVKEKKDVLNVGGFSDTVFDVMANFVEHGNDAQHWVDVIENQEV